MGAKLAAVLVVLAATLGPAATSASAEVLVNQPPGPSGIGVPSNETSVRDEALDDFDVPTGAHWALEAIRVFGSPAIESTRTFRVGIYWGGGGDFPITSAADRVFSETVTVPGGPDYLIPLEGAPRLGHTNMNEPGQYWISVQAQSAGGEGNWSWLTGPDTPETAPASPRGSGERPEGAEAGQAFQLLGTTMQVLKANVIGTGTIVSNPPGISCPGTCAVEFPRGTTVTLTPTALAPSVEFTQWGFLHAGFMGPPSALVPIQVPTPCIGTTDTCTFTLAQDEQVEANFAPIDNVDILRVVRDRHTGRGELLVWVPGEGVLFLSSAGLRTYHPGSVPTGIVRIPLIPTRKIAKALRRKGHATISAEVQFRAAGISGPTLTRLPIILVRKTFTKPTRRIH